MSSMEMEYKGDTIFLKGYLDESVDNDVLISILKSAEENLKEGYVKINFSEVTMGNSVGILCWLKAIAVLKDISICYSQAPKWLISQLNMVPQFMNENAVVESFEVPFYCEETEDEISKLFVVGQDIEIKTDSYDVEDFPPVVKDDNEYTIDVLPKNYFRFINDNAEAFNSYFKKTD